MKELSTFFSLFVHLLCLHSNVKADVSISSYPTPLYIREGNTFTLTCHFRPYTFHLWEHPTVGNVSQTSGHLTVQVSNSAFVANLIVGSATSSRDEGQYTCYARTDSGALVSYTVQARLYDPVRISTPTNEVATAVQGETSTVSLHCNAEHQTQIVWRRLGQPNELRNMSDGHIVILSDRLVINSVNFSDNGTYVCTASNRVGYEYIYSHVVVYVGAGVTASPSSIAVAEGDPAQFHFTVTGSPIPTVEWFKNTVGEGFRINPLPPQLQSELGDEPITVVYRLSFTTVRSEDTGTYICRVSNTYRGMVTAQITLQLNDALGPPQQVIVSVVNQTKINVTWSPPDGSGVVDSYTVVWQSLSGTPRSYVVDGNVLHYLIDDELTRLTKYTVYVYASNDRGKGSDGQRVNVTTDAEVPGAPEAVTIIDIGPTSVRLEWRFGDNGGAVINGIYVTFVTLESETEFVAMNIEPEQTSAIIRGLKDNHQYRLRLQARNRIGLGPPLDSEVFHTAPPGRPGSPSHVTATGLLDDRAALVCWEPSEVGQPFLSYTIEVLEVKTNVTKIWKIAAEIVKENLPNCTAGYTVTGLLLESCYRFKVVVSNSQGQGYPSAYSEEFCVPLSMVKEGLSSDTGRGGLETQYIAVIVAVILSVVLLVAVAFLVWCIVARVRHGRKIAKFPTGTFPPDDMRRSSSRSDRILLEPSIENGRLHHQISIGSYTSSEGGASTAGEDTPQTATTLLSENNFPLEVANSRSQPNYTQDQAQQFIGSRVNRSGSATLPVMNGLTLYPIPEHDTPSQTLPYHATPPNYPPPYSYCNNAPSSVGPVVREKFEEEPVEMTDNPLNDEFEKKMLAEGHDSRPNFSHEIDLPEDEPPPYVPPYRGDDLESEMSIPMGESCSQPPHSPQLTFNQRNNSRNRTNHDRSGRQLQPGHDHNILTPTTCSFNLSSSDNEEEDTEFIDNEAYQKVGESQFAIAGLLHVESGGFGSQNTISSDSRCSPIVTFEGRGYSSQQRMIEDNDGSKPRFKIGKGGRRGDVFEKVELHH